MRIEELQAVGEIAERGFAYPPPLPRRPGAPMTVAWVGYPPSRGSGGQTTIFRMVEALEAAGHTCVYYVLDHHGWSLGQHRANVSAFSPGASIEVRNVADGIEDAHVIMATSWQTAYPVAASKARGARCYFVQDFEPSFYPAGSEYMLAEATYRLGLHGITAGRWLEVMLGRDYGMRADSFDFGCDLSAYRLEPQEPHSRSGIAYYCKPGTPRRAHELALAALAVFARQHPEVPLHFYGLDDCGPLPFAYTRHGVMSPRQLGTLYNRCVAGLSLSASNVSLVPLEMLGSGCIPVVNDAEHNRMVLDNPWISYAPPTPHDLAGALSALVERPPVERVQVAAAAAASVTGRSWVTAGRTVEAALSAVVAARTPVVL